MMASQTSTEPHWKLVELLRRSGVIAHGPAPDGRPIAFITDDSRNCAPGCCFVAVKGADCDGHRFVEAAVAAGATAVVIDQPVSVPVGVCEIHVDDTRSALARLAAAYHRLCGDTGRPMRVVGVTGTNGKTTVAWLLRSILRAAGHKTALFGTVEYDLAGQRLPSPLTTPGALTLCEHLATARSRGATHAVMEVSSHAMDQRRVDGLEFVAGVFTNLSGDHLDYHGTMEEYFAAKRRLFETLSPDAAAILNADDPRCDALRAATQASCVTYGIENSRADWSASIERMDRTGSRLRLSVREQTLLLNTSMIGNHNVQNVLAAAATAGGLGVTWTAIAEGLESCGGAPGRLQRTEPRGWPFSVFVDYAHTDDALRNVLTALRPLTSGRLICVFGCGGDRDRTKRRRMASVAEQFADVAWVTSDNPRTERPEAIVEEIVAGFSRRGRFRVEVEVDRRAAICAALREAAGGDTVLIAGKGHENYQMVGRQTLPFDDVEEARRWMGPAVVHMEVA
jgi:UDP-N-acetylmuramoyl-L-alanyl-D-glutamate--2,6-diaminopimelate ligase